MNAPRVLDYKSMHEWWVAYVEWELCEKYGWTHEEYLRIFEECAARDESK